MSKVVAIMSMSLDGFVADLDDGVAEVFDWYFNSGDVEFHTGGADPMTFKVSGPSAEHLRELTSGLGAVLTGRRTFEVADGWGGKSVGVHGADTIQQLLNAGLLDEIQVDVAALLLGSGVRLFDRLAGTPLALGDPKVIPGVGVTHLRYPVRRA
jgi:dihydrofolate reductase